MPAGGAASLALVAELSIVPSPWGQAIDSAIGVEVAISLVPPTAMIGIGWTLGTPWEPGRQKHKWLRLHAFGHISRSFSSHATAIFFSKDRKIRLKIALPRSLGFHRPGSSHTRIGFYPLLNGTAASSIDTSSADNSLRIRANFD